MEDVDVPSESLLIIAGAESPYSDIELDILDYLVLAICPGSYSGLRVGSSFIKGLAFSIKKNIIPINTIESMNSTLDIQGNYYIAIFSHRDYIFYQEFLTNY